jgi:hypothetical protein
MAELWSIVERNSAIAARGAIVSAARRRRAA